jgi:hypothetical protein
MERSFRNFSLVSLVAVGSVVAQTADPQAQYPVQSAPSQADGNWHRFSDSPRQNQSSTAPYSSSNPQQQPPAPAPSYNPPPVYNQPQSFNVPYNLTIPAGTWLTVRTTNPISSDHNQAGDAFGAVLTQPIVINGLVVARRGQSVEGRVTSSDKAGRVKGVSKLNLELIQMAVVDGQQVNLHTQLAQRNGNTSIGSDAAAIGISTGTGAAIGAAVNGGVGAGIGAGIGLAASLIGVLTTRGEPVIVHPETVLTFRTIDPITISTTHSPDAFQPVNQQDYEGNTGRLVSSAPQPHPAYAAPAPYPAPYPYAAPAPYAAPYPYAYPYPYVAPYLSFGYTYGRGYGYGYGVGGPGFYVYGGGHYGGGYYHR